MKATISLAENELKQMISEAINCKTSYITKVDSVMFNIVTTGQRDEAGKTVTGSVIVEICEDLKPIIPDNKIVEEGKVNHD